MATAAQKAAAAKKAADAKAAREAKDAALAEQAKKDAPASTDTAPTALTGLESPGLVFASAPAVEAPLAKLADDKKPAKKSATKSYRVLSPLRYDELYAPGSTVVMTEDEASEQIAAGVLAESE